MRNVWGFRFATVALPLFGVLILTLGFTAPVRAACSSTTCQGSHTPSGARGAGVGCCITGDLIGSQDDVSWNITTCFNGGYYDGQYSQKDWTSALTNIAHVGNCVTTIMQSCIPCGFAPFQTGNCTTKPVRSASMHRHQRTNQSDILLWDHMWTTSMTESCACGVHGCTQ